MDHYPYTLFESIAIVKDGPNGRPDRLTDRLPEGYIPVHNRHTADTADTAEELVLNAALAVAFSLSHAELGEQPTDTARQARYYEILSELQTLLVNHQRNR